MSRALEQATTCHFPQSPAKQAVLDALTAERFGPSPWFTTPPPPQTDDLLTVVERRRELAAIDHVKEVA